ncbi:MAG: carbohydrate ABC transporter permease [Nocardioides sp.]|uniref:carbohydrate ABC transporter permease n=1 Tax=Nocardioides sp. TaxID=35761 RepID=UPI0039E5E8E1
MFSVFPTYWALMLSFKPPGMELSQSPDFIFRPTLQNYDAALPTLWPYASHSIVVAVASTTLSMAAGCLAAYAIARFGIRGREGFMFAILVTLMVPPIVIAIPLYLLAIETGTQGTLLAVALAQALFNTPMVVWMMRSFFEDVPIAIEESAQIDGASTWRTFIYIALPLVRPGIIATATLSAFYSWSEFLLANTLAGPDSQTLPVRIAGFNRDASEVLWGQLGATIVVSIVPTILFTLLIQRYLVRGITFGAVKD